MLTQSVTIVGPTACGKTHRAVQVARAFDGEVISADSRQVYKGMTIGTGKDIGEYCEIPYHLIDIAEAGDKYNLYRFLRDFNRVYAEILSRRKTPVICGGSGMYVENAIKGVVMPEVPENSALRDRLSDKSLTGLTEILKGYKSLHNTTDVDTIRRAVRAIEIQEYYRCHPDEAKHVNGDESKPLNTLVIGIDIPREERRSRISRRLRTRLEEGMVDEVRVLLDSGVTPDDLIYYGLEYKFVTLFILGRLSYDQMIHDLEIAIHQFAKRQMTWFRGMETRGTKINWLPYDLSEDEFIGRVRYLVNE